MIFANYFDKTSHCTTTSTTGACVANAV